MNPMWCENIKMVQDELSIWPSVEVNILIVLGLIGLFILYLSLLYEKWSEGTWTDVMWNKGTWTGLIMISLCLFGFDGLTRKAERAESMFMSDQKVELIGQVSDLEIDLNDRSHNFNGVGHYYSESAITSGPISYDTIRRDPQMFLGSYKLSTTIPMTMGGHHSRFSPRPMDIIWFKVDGRLIRSHVKTVGFNSGNECDGHKCGLRAGDQVRISLSRETLLTGRPIIRNLSADGKPKRELEYRDYYSDTIRVERCDDDLSTAL